QSGQMQRLLTLADYADPYLTMKPAFEGAVLEDFADLVEQGLVSRALKPVHWSIANRTALAEAELEYEDREDLSVYVDFEAADREAVERAFGCELDCTPSFTI
ncbi:MAG: class I tRNA ligase family protein, partial [Planctomycetota bacterium]